MGIKSRAKLRCHCHVIWFVTASTISLLYMYVGSGRMLALSITSSHFVAHGQVEHWHRVGCSDGRLCCCKLDKTHISYFSCTSWMTGVVCYLANMCTRISRMKNSGCNSVRRLSQNKTFSHACGVPVVSQRKESTNNMAQKSQFSSSMVKRISRIWHTGYVHLKISINWMEICLSRKQNNYWWCYVSLWIKECGSILYLGMAKEISNLP